MSETSIKDLQDMPHNKTLRKIRLAFLETLERFQGRMEKTRLIAQASLLVSVSETTLKKEKRLEWLIKPGECITIEQGENPICTLTATGQIYLNIWRQQIAEEQRLKELKFEEAEMAKRVKGKMPKIPFPP